MALLLYEGLTYTPMLTVIYSTLKGFDRMHFEGMKFKERHAFCSSLYSSFKSRYNMYEFVVLSADYFKLPLLKLAN